MSRYDALHPYQDKPDDWVNTSLNHVIKRQVINLLTWTWLWPSSSPRTELDRQTEDKQMQLTLLYVGSVHEVRWQYSNSQQLNYSYKIDKKLVMPYQKLFYFVTTTSTEVLLFGHRTLSLIVLNSITRSSSYPQEQVPFQFGTAAYA